MKTAIFINSILLLFFSNPAVAQSFLEVNNCLKGIHKIETSNEGTFSSLLLTGNKLGGTLLVATEKGAEIIQGTLNEKDQTLSFVFTPPGQKEKLMSSYQIQGNNELLELWTKYGVEESLSPTRKLTGKETLTLAGQKSFETAQLRARDIDSHLDRLEKSIQGMTASIKKKDIGLMQDKVYQDRQLQEILKDNEEVYSKYLVLLKSCDGLPDKNIQKATVVEKERLERFQRKLIEIGRAEMKSKNKPSNSSVQ